MPVLAPLVRWLSMVAVGYVASNAGSLLRPALKPAGPFLRKLGVGVTLIVTSAIAWAVALLFLLMSLFFYMGNADTYILPSLVTGIISMGIGVALVLIGFNMLRQPYRR